MRENTAQADMNVSDTAGSTSPSQTTNNVKKKDDDDPSSYTILIVDDEPDTALFYRSVLEEQEGFKVDVFNDPLEALAKLKEVYSRSQKLQQLPTTTTSASAIRISTKKPYDLLLIDIKMPKMNGFELYREIKKILKENDDEQANIKTCFITAYELYYQQLKQEFPKIDVGCYIKKPIDATELVKRIKEELLLLE
jgi:CheY-like chemotaxis protein